MKFTTCQMCGKQYFKRPGSIYNLIFAGKRYNFCCHRCYRQAQKCKEHIIKVAHESDYAKFQKELKKPAEVNNV